MCFSQIQVLREFCTIFPFFQFVLLAFYECFSGQFAALCVDTALGMMRIFWAMSSVSAWCKFFKSWHWDVCGAEYTISSLLLAFSRKSKRRMSGYWRNMVTAWWTTTRRGLPTLRLNPQVSFEVVATIPKWACWRDASCQKTSSLTAASEHWMLHTLALLSR